MFSVKLFIADVVSRIRPRKAHCPDKRCQIAPILCKCSAVAEMGDRLATIDMGQKFGGCALLGGGAAFTCNTMRPWSKPTFVPSDTLIHPAVWPQQTRTEIWQGAVSLGRWSWVRI